MNNKDDVIVLDKERLDKIQVLIRNIGTPAYEFIVNKINDELFESPDLPIPLLVTALTISLTSTSYAIFSTIATSYHEKTGALLDLEKIGENISTLIKEQFQKNIKAN